MAAVFVISMAAFIVGMWAIRAFRRRMLAGDDLSESFSTENALYPYSAVIQQLKQQKFALENEQKTQRRRARISEHITSAVIANLPCGVLFVTPNGLVRQANAAARQMLGFASPLGMSLEELFRGATGTGHSGAPGIADVFRKALQDQSRLEELELVHRTPSGDSRPLKLAVVPLRGPSSEPLGMACAITDESALAGRREAEVLRSEHSAELALELRNSLSVIRACADQMCGSADRERSRDLAQDIAAETRRLELRVGEFLSECAGTQASAAGA